MPPRKEEIQKLKRRIRSLELSRRNHFDKIQELKEKIDRITKHPAFIIKEKVKNEETKKILQRFPQ